MTREAKLKLLLTDEFLATLVEAVRTCGWSGDHTENMYFVEWCFEIADKPIPQDMNPYDDEQQP